VVGASGVEQSRPVPFHWAQRTLEGTVLVALAGELDIASAVPLRQVLATVVATADAARVLLDMRNVRFIDCVGIGLIVEASAAARADGRVLHVSAPCGAAPRLFRILGLDSMLLGDGHGDAADRPADG
jgi:anti-anti-sigma factor